MARFAAVPVIARWMVSALGSVHSRRSLRPLDPVAAWMLAQHPDLHPTNAAPALASTIRARADVIDALVVEEFDGARSAGERVAMWTVGGGFDARWYRLRRPLRGVAGTVVEVDAPSMLSLKHELLSASPYADAWRAVRTVASDEAVWRVERDEDARVVVVLEALAGRWETEPLRALLARLREGTPEARVIASVPGWAEGDRVAWSRARLHDLGWKVHNDVRVGPRGRLLAPGGHEICPGMYPFRVVVLGP